MLSHRSFLCRLFECRCVFLIIACTILSAAPTFAAVTAVDLLTDFTDFALHPETGDILALNAEKSEAVLLRQKDLQQGQTKPSAPVKVGATPCCVCFKRFGELRVFAIVCSQDSHMYLINAADFTLLKKVVLVSSDVSNVTCSLNINDPFLYYNYGGGHDSATGAVSLRDFRDRGSVFGDSMESVISANGEVAYRRGPWSPSGFESLIRTNKLTDDKPVFTRLFYDHTSVGTYVPDRFDRFTAAGNMIYTRSLEKKEAQLDFTPTCFFEKRPIVIGQVYIDRFRTRNENPAITLRAASYNTFSSVGEPVVIPPTTPKDAGQLPRGGPSHADFKQVGKRLRIFADDRQGAIVYANRDRIHLVPLAEFKVPDEPFLLANVVAPTKLIVGQSYDLELKPLDPRVQITVDDMPAGLERAGTKLKWKPAAEQVGEVSLTATLKHGDIQRTVVFPLSVVYPSVELPFAPINLAVDSAGQKAVIWDGPVADEFGRPAAMANNSQDTHMAVLNLADNKIVAQKTINDVWSTAAVGNNFVFLTSATDSARCEIFRLNDLQREKVLRAKVPILGTHITDKVLLLRTAEGIEAYEPPTFQSRAGLFKSPLRQANAATSVATDYGFMFQGVLYDFELKPKLLFESQVLPSLAGFDPNSSMSIRLQPSSAAANRAMGRMRTPNGQNRLASLTLPGTDIQLSLDERLDQKQVPGSVHTVRTQRQLTITIAGDTPEQIILERQTIMPQEGPGGAAPTPILRTNRDEVFVVARDQMYRYRHAARPADAPAETKALKITPMQTAFALSGTGKTTLNHQAVGGKKPVTFSSSSPYDAMTIHETTGALQIDEKMLLPDIEQAIEKKALQLKGADSLWESMTALTPQFIEQASSVLGRKPVGWPVAIPIRVEATDADGQSAILQYFVLAEVPSVKVAERLKRLDSENPFQITTANRAPAASDVPPNLPADNSAKEIADLRKRIDHLESRLDVITGQFNSLLKQLNEGKTK